MATTATITINGEVTAVETGPVYNRVNVRPTDETSLGGGETEKENAGVGFTFFSPIAQLWTVGGACTIVISQTAAS